MCLRSLNPSSSSLGGIFFFSASCVAVSYFCSRPSQYFFFFFLARLCTTLGKLPGQLGDFAATGPRNYPSTPPSNPKDSPSTTLGSTPGFCPVDALGHPSAIPRPSTPAGATFSPNSSENRLAGLFPCAWPHYKNPSS